MSRYLNRPLSRPVARVLAPLPVTPNMVSVASLLIAAAALGAFALDWPIVAGLLIHASSVVDGVDGDLARLQGTASRFGAIFDATLDRYADALILAGMALWSFRETDLPAPLAIGFAAIALGLAVSYSRARIEASAPGVEGAAAGIASRDVRLFVAALASILGQAYWALALIAVLSGTTLLHRLWRLRRILAAEGPQAPPPTAHC